MSFHALIRSLATLILAFGLTPLAGTAAAVQPPPAQGRAALPDESKLPGQAATGGGALAPTAIPDETALPDGQRPAAGVAAVPDETALPGAAPADAAEPGDALAAEPELSPGTLRPWLRLRFDGHTGKIRCLAISPQGDVMVSAGEDKDVHVWMRKAERDDAPAAEDDRRQAWYHRRTIRWQIERGPRGRIYAVALHGNLLALAGHGATGGLGEVWIVDLNRGDLIRPLVDVNQGHRQVITSLAWQPLPQQGDTHQVPDPAASPTADAQQSERDGERGTAESADTDSADAPAPETDPAAAAAVFPALATADVSGRVLLWSVDTDTGIWSPRSVVAPDRETYGEALAAALAPLRRFLPITFLGPDQLLVPRYVGPAAEPAGSATWHLQRYRLSSGQSDLLPIPHFDMVLALRASADGKRLASSDGRGRLLVTHFLAGPDQPVSEVIAGRTDAVLSLDFDPAGQRLLVGGSGGTVQWYELSAGAEDDNADAAADAAAGTEPEASGAVKLLSSLQRPALVWGAVVDAAHQEIALAVENRIEIFSLGDDQTLAPDPVQTLAAAVGPVFRVAFSKDSPPYKIALSHSRPPAAGEPAPLAHAFDLSAVRLERDAEIDAAQYRDPTAASDGWSIRLDETGTVNYMYEGEQRRARLPLKGELHGLVSTVAWMDESLPEDADRSPRKIAVVGTEGRNNLYVFEATAEQDAKLLRQYRDHGGMILSVSTSADGRYLASGSEDATVGIWNLADVFTASPWENRWGANFELRDGQLYADTVRVDGPLFFRGVRSGDRLVSLAWVQDGVMQAAADGEAMLQALVDVAFDTLVVFEFSRLGVPREGFQSFPAWQPLARLFVDASREWAIWTPAGFYDASFNGHELFGWQINRGVSMLPEYFRAAQFRARLERPAVIRQLLSAGSLDGAMRQSVSGLAPPAGEGAIVNQFLNKPKITLLRPQDGEIISDGQSIVEADILIPRGATLVPPKVFAGGVPGIEREQVEVAQEGDGQRYRYRWRVRLPSDRRVPLEVLAATDSQAVGRARIELDNRTPPPTRMPRMHFLAIGISDYADPQIQQLDFAARGAGVMADLFAQHTRGLYRTVTSQLTDRDAIGPLWREYAAQAARELAVDIAPDDVVVMYLCGHGLRDRRTNRWYFVTADARYSDLMNDRYDDLLSFDDLAALAELPCRKLAILDSCHSGAVQPALREDDLKSALRLLQGDVVLTMTASEGEEEAAEQKDRQLGRFTAHLVDALSGRADENADDVVSLGEAIRYVTAAVQEESRTLGFVQHPTAGPAHWLETIELPLTRPVTATQ